MLLLLVKILRMTDLEKSNHSIIKSKVAELFNAEVTNIDRLMGGMSNYTYVVEFNSKKYTFRIPGKGAENFVDRKVEKDNIDVIKEGKFCPFPIFFEIETGYKIAEYVEGQITSKLQEVPYQLVANTLKKVHSLPKLKHDYNPLERLSKYESITSFVDTEYLKLKEKWMNIYETVLSIVELKCCHGDSQTSNFVLDGSTLYLMDWEFAGNNDPIYDIACFGNVNFDQALELINVYFDEVTNDHYQRLFAWRMFQCLQWHNVAKYKAEIGLSEELGIDFGFVASTYLEKATKFFEDYQKYV